MKKLFFISTAVVVLSLALPTFSIANTNSSAYRLQVDYNPIEVSEVPNVIVEAFSGQFSDCEIEKAFVGNDDTYKIESTIEGHVHSLIFNQDGSLLTDDIAE